jgi:hypothetical protein
MRTEPDCDYDKCVIICDSHGSDRKTFEVMTSTWPLGTLGSAAGMLQRIDKNELYDKRDDFNFPIVNFPFICSNIPAAEPRVPSGQVEVITSKVLRSLPTFCVLYSDFMECVCKFSYFFVHDCPQQYFYLFWPKYSFATTK